MYVCVCLAVTEAEVEAAIAGGATTRDAVTRACRAGGDCGACHGMIEQKIEDHLEGQAAQSGTSRPSHPPHPSHPPLVGADALVRARGRAA
ncbi:MAG: BFD-like [2Fe-2S] binding domain [Labilithrix sp.]|nr:BFD-like [2Fe-2S] binding domain [Labilithrix sp.]